MNADLKDDISKSKSLSPDRKEIYLQILPYLSSGAQSHLWEILANEKARTEEITTNSQEEMLVINTHYIHEIDELVRKELKTLQATQEAEESTTSADELLKQLDNL